MEFDSLPVDISWDFEVESLPTVASANFGFAINNDGTRTSGPFVSFDVQTDGDVTGDIRNSTGTVVSFGTTVTIVPGTIVHARFRVESTQVRAKAWTTGVEPATWDRTISSGSFTPTYLVPVGQNSAISVVGTDVLVDNITINEGITDPPDTNPCGTEEEPDPDPPDDGAYCESPPTEDGYTYHTTSAFMPNSERVYVQGLLIRRTTDYTTVPALGEVTIDTALIDGLTGDPEVQVCFEAWGLPEIS